MPASFIFLQHCILEILNSYKVIGIVTKLLSCLVSAAHPILQGSQNRGWHESFLSHRGPFRNPEHLLVLSLSPLKTFRDPTISERIAWIAQSLGFDGPLDVIDCPGNSKWTESVSIRPRGWRRSIIIVLFKPTVLSSALLWLACLKVSLSNKTDLTPFLSLWLPCLSLELYLKLANDDLGAVIVCRNEKLVTVFRLNTTIDYCEAVEVGCSLLLLFCLHLKYKWTRWFLSMAVHKSSARSLEMLEQMPRG